VRLDAAAGLVEFDGRVAINAHSDQTPRVYLEALACTLDTKEHESIVVTRALPSHVHAALLLLGLEPGKPGEWNWEGESLKAIPPTGERVSLTLGYEKDGAPVEVPLTDLAWSVQHQQSLSEMAGQEGFCFAGSMMVKRQGRDWYRADGEGTLIGLATFGGETLAWTRMYNPDSGVEEPHWIARREAVPPFDTPVVVRVRRLGPPTPPR
jgi:hypothetical protein